MVACPICNRHVFEININRHIDSECREYIETSTPPPGTQHSSSNGSRAGQQSNGAKTKPLKGGAVTAVERFFTPAAAKKPVTAATLNDVDGQHEAQATISPIAQSAEPENVPHHPDTPSAVPTPNHGLKRPPPDLDVTLPSPLSKRPKPNAALAPLADRMRPRSLDDILGHQHLVGPQGLLRILLLSSSSASSPNSTNPIPSLILWGPPGTGKTTLARLLCTPSPSSPGPPPRLVEIHTSSSGIPDLKKIFQTAKAETSLTGRRTVLFVDEIHRFTRTQQDALLAPVEEGVVTLVGATTENPSFRITGALLSRCRVWRLERLGPEVVRGIVRRALEREVEREERLEGAGEGEGGQTPRSTAGGEGEGEEHEEGGGSGGGRGSAAASQPTAIERYPLLTQHDGALLDYISAVADGDARTALNLLELALSLCRHNPSISLNEVKQSLTRTLVYDRAGDNHYDAISAFHKSVRGSNADAALFYLARMLQAGEDPLFIARRMVVIASEDVGLADNSLLSLATATYSAVERIGMPECRINLAHCAVALALSPKSVRAYRGLNAAFAALQEPGVAGLPVPLHMRNAPTRLMREMGYGKEYKYNPDYVDGRVVQEYLPEQLKGRRFLGKEDLGDQVDPEMVELDEEAQVAADYEPGGVAVEVLLNPDGD